MLNLLTICNNKTAIRYNPKDDSKQERKEDEKKNTNRQITPVQFVERPKFKRSYGKIKLNQDSSIKLLANESLLPSLKTIRDLRELRKDSKYSYNPLPKLSNTQSQLNIHSNEQINDQPILTSSRYSQRNLNKERPISKIKIKPVIDLFALNTSRQQQLDQAKKRFGLNASSSQASLFTCYRDFNRPSLTNRSGSRSKLSVSNLSHQ